MEIREDSFHHKGKRKNLMKLLAQKGIKSSKVLEVMNEIPRHWYMDVTLETLAYENRAYLIGAEQTISHPFTVALQTELLNIRPNDKILEIGTGSGYQTTVLVGMGARVYTIERQQLLFKTTSKFLREIQIKPEMILLGDGYKGIPKEAPFQGIIVTAGAPEVPKGLLGQLDIGGRLVIPIGDENQVMWTFTRESETSFTKESFGEFKFVPMLKNKNF